MDYPDFAPKLIDWYNHHQRDLPWRHTKNPYFIWLSEVILQQTRVAQGLPYYVRFTEKYPTIFDLAAADEQELMRLWQGLGYYSRARNLHATAKLVVAQLDGKFPERYAELIKLKGIGPYTAAAIASFAFGERVAVVDGNVYRVLARIFGVDQDITSTEGKKTFQSLANALISPHNPSAYNQAIMEFGAVQCSPASPDCLLCPFQEQCVANATGQQNKLPVKAKKAPPRKRFFHYFVVEQNGKLALKQRTQKDIWQELYDFYLLEPDAPAASLDELDPNDALRTLLQNASKISRSDGFVHLLTHQTIEAVFWRVTVEGEKEITLPEGLVFYSATQIEQLPKPVLIGNYLATNYTF